jgi:eukaryotic translation initiation factor 2C
MRSLRHSSSGLPLLNIDIAVSPFLATGPALEVIAKILDGRRGGKGGYGLPGQGGNVGGVPATGAGSVQDIQQLDVREITIIRNKLQGVKVDFV